ncbi:Bifunctional DNA primase/polymerase [Desulfarculus baarsii DSM 2075]|uniref:Bifunctional DNA primase/polymerase n=1 Tax=Desulfarculus baarsii (strain ATCC 33931 / DSM 2075 / LMG 7858 / VKM B-1802 / 2st14) TaxID=644282 RepID=E1QHP4_DESB2|nr:bifunctional DNA primase/polymerase [Desulfarculus baarsii]ADK85087.1 Bifunctional DNA primase/polymerase [Desulfarculus baarsii DSM 2075]
MIEAAQRYASLGWAAIPVGADKRPLRPWAEYQTRRPEAGELADWFGKPGAMVGVVTGKVSNLLVVDADNSEAISRAEALLPDGLELPIATTPRGRHYYFAHREGMKNAVGVMPAVDVRAEGGYVVAPPGPGREWLVAPWDCAPPELPAQLEDVVRARAKERMLAGVKVDPGANLPQGERAPCSRYGRHALADELTKIALAGQGGRNRQINDSSFAVGQLVGAGLLAEDGVRAALIGAGLALGLGQREVAATVASGLAAGIREPRNVDNVDNVDIVDTCGQVWTGVDRCGHLWTGVDTCGQDMAQRGRGDSVRFGGNLAAEISEWVANSTGSFTTADVDREFGLVDRRDRKNRSMVLTRLIEEKKIKRDPRQAGRFHILASHLEFVDLASTDGQPFGLALPLGLDQMVSLPPKSIVVLAGQTNAGKTALALNILRDNIGRQELLYCMSEMGPQEYRQRVGAFGDPLDHWRAVRAASLASGFDDAIAAHNRDGLTVVDYLEERDGEYFKIASDIRGVYDALGNGVAFVCLQKKTGATFGRGGEATAEKSRLYMALDVLTHARGRTVCALKIVKAKAYPGRNPNGLERHFVIHHGWRLEPVSDWVRLDDRERAAYATKYEATLGRAA